jgi:nicotinate-nucleotide--dimethylbenzimidazole phosphoribosyltransferase
MDKTVAAIKPVSPEWISKAFARLDSLTKPRRSLGYLEDLAARYVAIREEERPAAGGKRVFVFAGDHKVVEEGVSAYPSDVTGLMVKNFMFGGAAINALTRFTGASLEVIDVGMATDPGTADGLVNANVKRAADNIAKGPAMSVDEAARAIEVGIERASLAARSGATMMATGEMGIGNTTPAAALLAAYMGLPAAALVGAGTGLDADGVARKRQVVEKALAVNGARLGGPLETLAALGGLEIAGICGLCLGAAANRSAVVVDGFISTAGALAAMRLCPAVKGYLFFAHMSAEPGHRRFFETEGLRPILDLGMRLGEGTGAVLAMQLIEASLAVYNSMATFADAGIAPGA